MVPISADVARAAAELIAQRGEREAEAYRLGRLDGFADGWTQGLAAGLERAA